MRRRRHGLLLAALAAAVVLVPAGAAGASSTTASGTDDSTGNSAWISAAPGAASNIAGQALRFDDSSNIFRSDAGPNPSMIDISMEHGVPTQADVLISSPANSPITARRYEDAAPGTTPLLEIHLEINHLVCTAAGITDITDLARDTSGQVSRLAMTFSYSCLEMQPVIGEIRYHEPRSATAVSSSPTRIDYGGQDVGLGRDAPVRFTNTSPAPLALTGTTTTGPFKAVSSSCDAALAPGASCDVVTRFTPTTAGPATGSLTLAGPDGAAATVPLAGIGRPGFSGLKIRSNSGDYIGDGRSYSLSSANGSRLLYYSTGTTGIQFEAYTPEVGSTPRELWDVNVTAPAGAPLRTGQSFAVQRDRYQDASHGGLDVAGDGRSCNAQTGTVYVADLETAPNGRVTRYDLRFSQLCSGSTAPLTGEVAYAGPVVAPKVAISGASSRRTVYGATVTLTGTADPLRDVEVWFQQAGTSSYVQRRSLVTSGTGTWSTTYLASNDNRVYATSAGAKSPTVLIQIAPTITGPAQQTVRKGSTYTITGTGIPGSFITVHFHKAGTAANDYSILRTTPVASNGRWTRPYAATTDYRFFATLPNGQASPGVLVQAR